MTNRKSRISPDEAGFLMLYGHVESHKNEKGGWEYISRRYYEGNTYYGFGVTPLDAAIDSDEKVENIRAMNR